MPSNEERREMVAMLRDIEGLRNAVMESPLGVFLDEIMAHCPEWESTCKYLADLIEPLPERTCRVERMEIDEFGRYFYLSCGHMQMTHNNSALPYCPICGAKVIE